VSEETIAGNLATVEAHFHSETATMLEKMLVLRPGEASNLLDCRDPSAVLGKSGRRWIPSLGEAPLILLNI